MRSADKVYKREYFDQLVDTFLAIGSETNMRDFLEGLLTLKEIKELSIRLQIVQKLLGGEPHHKIAEDLSTGVATVTRGSKELKRGRFKTLSGKKKEAPPLYSNSIS